MAFPRSIILKRIAIGAVAAIATLSLAMAQAPDGAQAPANAQGPGGGGRGGGGRGRGGPTYTPAAGAKDLKSVLFNWGWYMGMLRSDQERDLMMTLEYQGKGTVQVNGQPCNVTKYRTSISYRASGERIQYRARGPRARRAPVSKTSVEHTLGTTTSPAPNSSPVKARRRRCPATAQRNGRDSPVGKSARVRSRARSRGQATWRFWRPSRNCGARADASKAGKLHLRLVGERQARCVVPDSGRPQCDRDRDA